MNAASNIIPFQFEASEIRTVLVEGRPHFVGKDVASALGYANPQKAVRDHCMSPQPVGEGVNDSFTPPAHTLDPQTVIISQSDVLRLIVNSRLPAAQRFERWVFDDVLPTLLRTGRYEIPSYSTLDAARRRAVNVKAQEAAQSTFRSLQRQIGTIVGKLGLTPEQVERVNAVALLESGLIELAPTAADLRPSADVVEMKVKRPATGAERQRLFRERRKAAATPEPTE